PHSALENVAVDHCLPLADIPALLVRLAHEPVALEKGGATVSEELEQETDAAELDLSAVENKYRPGRPSGYGCPECGGGVWELHDGELVRFRCRVGHAWSADSLLAEQADALEVALWTALRALEESASLARRMAERARERGLGRAVQGFDQRVKDAEQHA